jgi:hypothetical protein
MTKQEFLSGKSFSLPYAGSSTYKYTSEHVEFGALTKEYRMSKDDHRVILRDSIMNVEKIGSKIVTLYTFLLGDKIVKKIRYEDMVEFTST